jgi:hypothetical protein
MIPYSGSLTEDDYVEIARLRRKIGPASRSLAEWATLLGVAFLALGSWAFIVPAGNTSGAVSWAALAVPCFLFGWFRRHDPRKEWHSHPQLREPYAGRITPDALESQMLGVDARVPWEAVTGYAATANALVLGMGHVDVPLVRRFFATEEDWQSARTTIEKSVPSPFSTFGVHARGRNNV